MNDLIPTRAFWATPVLILSFVLMFLIMSAMNLSFSQYSVQSLYWLGVNFAPWVEQGQYWRWVSSLFIHFGLMHLAFNSISIMFMGRMLEPLLGPISFIGLFLVSGIGGSAASFFFNEPVYSAGASGGVFGLFGAFAAILLSGITSREFRDQWLKTIGGILAINLVLGFVLPVDNAAHLGGLATGFVMGWLLLPGLIRKLRRAR